MIVTDLLVRDLLADDILGYQLWRKARTEGGAGSRCLAIQAPGPDCRPDEHCAGDSSSHRLCLHVNRVSGCANLAVIPHDDIHVAAELGEHAHQAFNGNITKLPA